MVRIDRRQTTTDPNSRKQSDGLTRAASDVDHDARFNNQQLSNQQWQILQGSVVVAIPQLGWHVVALEGLAGLIRAQVAGPTDIWGAQTVRAIQAGTSVLVACQEKTKRAVIVGNLSNELSDDGETFYAASFAGSQSGLSQDAVNNEYMQAASDETLIRGFDINPLWDQHAGDWCVRSNMGNCILLDNFGIHLIADEITGVHVDMLDQSVEISGLDLDIKSQGLNFVSYNAGMVSCIAQGQAVWASASVTQSFLSSTIDIKDQRDPEAQFQAYRESLADWRYELEYAELDEKDYSLHYPLQMTTMTGSSGVHAAGLFTGVTRVDASPTATEIHSANIYTVMSDLPGYTRSIEPRPSSDNNTFVQPYRALRDAVADSQNTAPNAVPPHLLQSLAVLDSLGVSDELPLSDGIKQVKETSVNKAWFPEVQLEPDSLLEALRTNESFTKTVVTPQPGTDYYGPTIKSLEKLLSFIRMDKNGDIHIVNEHGSGIRITGTGIYIESCQVRISTLKDIVMLGRDVHVMANNDVAITANDNLRVYSQKNLVLLSGNGGTGGTLIESRGTNTGVETAADPSAVVYSGVAIKAVKSNVAIYGGSILAKAGDRSNNVAGDLILVSDNGDFYTSASSMYVRHSTSGTIDTFGSSRDRITSANYFGPNLTVLSSQLSVQSLWSQGDVVAKSNVIAATGSMATINGGTLGSILPRDRQTLTQSLQQLTRTLNDQQKLAGEVQRAKKRAYFDTGRVLNSAVSRDLSSGFPLEKTSESVYNTKVIQTTYQWEFLQSIKPNADSDVKTESFKFMKVNYKPDSSTSKTTHAWPGNNATVWRARKDDGGDSRVGPVVTAYYNQAAITLATSESKKTNPATVFPILSKE